MKTALCVLLLSVLSLPAFAQPPVAWNKRYSSRELVSFQISICEAPDGKLVQFGTAGQWPWHLVMTTLTDGGDSIASSEFAIYTNRIIDALTVFDGGFLVLQDAGPHLIKFNSLGGISWTTTVPDWFGYPRSIVQLPDSNFIVGGYVHIAKVSRQGDTLWTRVVPGGAVYIDCIKVIPGGLIMAGHVRDQLFLIKTDGEANEIWRQYYSYFDDQTALCDCIPLSDGGYAFNGFNNNNTVTGFLFKTDADGNLQWHEISSLPNGNRLRLIENRPGSLIMIGGVGLYSAFYLSCWSLGGEFLWKKHFDDTFYMDDAIKLQDGGIAITGRLSHTVDLTEVPTVKFCAEEADIGQIDAISRGTQISGFRLSHISGNLSTLSFTGGVTGLSGSVTGIASAQWMVMPNGDGNNGDSIIFLATQPLTNGTIDTFWINGGNICNISWIAGCVQDTAPFSIGIVDSLDLSAANYGNRIELSFSVNQEENIESYTLWGRPATGVPYSQIMTFSAHNTGATTYHYEDIGRTPNYRYLLSAQDLAGCQYYYRDRILSLGVNVGIELRDIEVPSFLSLSAFPNPFNPSTTLAFSLSKTAPAKLAVFDILGREVKVLQEGMLTAGEHKLTFNGSNLPAGIYFARLESASHTQTQKLLLLK